MIMHNQEGDKIEKSEGSDKNWHFHPNLPLSNSPVFHFPPRMGPVLNWFRNAWLNLSGTTILVILAVFSASWLQPELDKISLEAVSIMTIRNFTLIFVIAGSLHLWFWKIQVQGEKFKYDARSMATNNKRFTLANQVYDNMFWTLVWGVPIWTFYEIVYFHAFAIGMTPVLTFREHPFLFIAMFWVILLWKGLHFYWVHRFLHHPAIYKTVHSVHHRNIITGPWSGISMHPLELLPYFSGLLIHLVIPSHPVHFLFHAYALALNPAFPHSGFDALFIKNKRSLKTGEFFHQLHHRYFNCNYGTPEMPWDKWFKTYHDGIRHKGKPKKAKLN